jgi:hypothetical protein
MVMANTQSSLREGIAEQIAATYRAQGAEIVARPCDADQNLWSIHPLRAVAPSGPNKVGDPDFVRSGVEPVRK